MITSAALYLEPQPGGTVPLEWLEEISELFCSLGLPITEFYLWGSGFSEDEHYDFEKERPRLVRALAEHRVTTLTAYANLIGDESGQYWRAIASCEMAGGMIFLGIEESIFRQPGNLLRRALEKSRSVPGIGYGIAYKYPLSE